MQRIFFKYLLLLCGVIALHSCYKESNFLDENTTTEDKNFPVVATFAVTNGATFKVGDAIKTELNYWSIDPIKEIRLYQTVAGVREIKVTKPYAAAFSKQSQTDSLLMEFPMPQLAVGTEVSVQAEVVNDNGLMRLSSIIKVKVAQ